MNVPPKKVFRVGFLLFSALILLLFFGSFLGVHYLSPDGGGRVALVRVEGPIMDSRDLVKTIRAYQENDHIAALVLRVDSPGGGVVPSQEIHDAVLDFRDTGKTVVASMGTVAASGGYYISAPADLIVANPGTLTGSIGVIMQMPNFEKLLDKVGVGHVTIKSGKNKDIGSPLRTMSAEERALLQGMMDDIHSQFIDAVAIGRELEVEQVRPLADGRVFTGRQALDAGLVDELGNLRIAVKRAGELAGIEGEPIVVEKKKSPLEQFLVGTMARLDWLGRLPTAGVGMAGEQPMYLWMP